MDEHSESDLLPVCLLLIFIAVFTVPLLRDLHHLPATRDYDGLQHLSFCYSLYDAVRNHGEFPLWNPYFGGGVRWAGYLYNPGISPWGLIYVIFGDVVGVKLCLIFSLLLGAFGTYGVARKLLLLPPFAALFAALLTLSSTWMAGRLDSGNYSEFSEFFWLFPLLCLHELTRGRLLGLLLPVYVLVALNPAKYGALTTFTAGLMIISLSSIYRERRRQAVLAWSLGTAFGLLLAMPKVLPLWDLLGRNLTPAPAVHSIGYQNITEIASRLVSLHIDSHHSFGVGPLALLLATIGILLGWRDARAWVILLVLATLLSMGKHAPYPLGDIASRMPLLSSVRDLGKYVNMFILTSICMLAAVGLHRAYLFTARMTSNDRRVGVLFVGFAALVLVFPLRSSLHYFDRAFTVKQPRYVREAFYHVAHTPLVATIASDRLAPGNLPYSDQYRNLRKNIGTITWYGNLVFKENAVPRILVEQDGSTLVNPRYIGDAALIGASSERSHVGGLRISYNTLRLRYSSPTPQRILLNFNFDSNWTSSAGRISEYQGLIAVDVDAASDREVVLTFTDPSFTAGIWLALFASLAWVVTFFGMRNWAWFRRERSTSGRRRPASAPGHFPT